ncbi:hypothetical protein KCA24_33890, partial [Escherichia coli]|nr:hypothetical protein [Escherichia coli]
PRFGKLIWGGLGRFAAQPCHASLSGNFHPYWVKVIVPRALNFGHFPEEMEAARRFIDPLTN